MSSAVSVPTARERGALAGILMLALGLHLWGLDQNGWGAEYYSAAVRSMAESARNFLFVAFDPSGFISVDKPPVFLWFGALSVRVFSYSSWAILL